MINNELLPMLTLLHQTPRKVNSLTFLTLQ